jgi:hypothetical protein
LSAASVHCDDSFNDYNKINQPLMVNTDNSVDSNTELAALSWPRLYMAANK